MPPENEPARRFELPGVGASRFERFDLAETTDAGTAVLSPFYPFDFGPVCATELCAIRDAEWFESTPNLDVWAISGDSADAHRAFAAEFDIGCPLLSDSAGRVAESYGVLYDEWEGRDRVPEGALVVVDSDRRIRYEWATDDALVEPGFVPVKTAVDEHGEQHENVDPANVELDPNY